MTPDVYWAISPVLCTVTFLCPFLWMVGTSVTGLGCPTYSEGAVGSKAWFPAFCQGSPWNTGTAYIIQSSH